MYQEYLCSDLSFYKKEASVSLKKYSITKRIALVTYVVILAYGTLIGRQADHDPLSIVFSGWMISYRQGSWDFNPVYNIFLLTPLMFLLLLNFPQIGGKTRDQLLKRSVIIGLLVSLFIECNQLIFCIGTFQISDLVYNTISSLIGGYLYQVYSKYLSK